MGNAWTTSVELWEKGYPHLFECGAQIVADSAGAGEFNGGPGGRVVIRAREGSTAVAGFGDGKVFPPQGVLGGESGAGNRGYIVDNNGERLEELPMVGIFEIPPGRALEALIAGGGGFGDPLDRDPERVRQDVRKGWVTMAKARDTYGVILDPASEWYTVDYEGTNTLRSRIRRKLRPE